MKQIVNYGRAMRHIRTTMDTGIGRTDVIEKRSSRARMGHIYRRRNSGAIKSLIVGQMVKMNDFVMFSNQGLTVLLLTAGTAFLPFYFDRFVLTERHRMKTECHRGVAIYNEESQMDACLRPPSYYGTHCQQQSERLTIFYRVDIPPDFD